MASHISKKRKFVADGVFKAELNDFLACELSEEGYSGCDVRVTHARTEVCTVTSRPTGICTTEIEYLDHYPRHSHPGGPW